MPEPFPARPSLDPHPTRTPEERAWDEFLEEVLRGEPQDLEDFCRRHPEISADLRERLAAFSRMLRGSPAGETARIDGPPPEPNLPAEHIGEFRLLRPIGAGGMGAVYLARQESLGRLVALKMVRVDRMRSPSALERFRREAQAVAKLRHPGVVTVFGTGEADGFHYLAMELVPGRNLDEALQEASGTPKRIPIAERLRWIAQIARALEAVHEAGLVHRDVKPSNIRITPEGRALLVDFGLARGLGDPALSAAGEFRGTPHYASPEQVAGKSEDVDARSDVYSLGATLYECVTGQVPFAGETPEQVFRRLLMKEPVPPRRINPSISRDLEVVLQRALEKDPDRRYPAAAAFAEDLESLLELRPIRARPAGPVTRCVKWVRRDPGTALGIGALVLSAAVIAGSSLERKWAQAREFEGEVSAAEAAFERGDFLEALAAYDRALVMRPGDAPAMHRRLEVLRREERDRADRALREVEPALERFRQARAAIGPIVRRIREVEAKAQTGALSDEERSALDADRNRLAEASLKSEEAFLATLEALGRASRADPANPDIEAAYARVYVERWREAVEAGDTVAKAVFRERVERYDHEGRMREAMEGDGTVEVVGAPAGADVFAFRFLALSELKPGGDRRLVPVPFDPATRTPVVELGGEETSLSARAGDPALVVEEVAARSPAERAGLQRGDLVFSLEGSAVADALFSVAVDPAGAAAAAGVRGFDRLLRVDGRGIAGEPSLERALAGVGDGGAYEAVFLHGGAETAVAATRGGGDLRADLGLSLAPADRALEVADLPATGLEATVWSGGRLAAVRIEGGGRSGLRVRPTASPLALDARNRWQGLTPLEPIRLPAGSYLFLFRKEGYEDLRLPVHVGSEARVQARAEMLDAGTSPAGFEWIPPGPFVSGGDPEAPDAWEPSPRDVPGFWISRTEVSVSEYAEFLNDPVTLREIALATGRGEPIRLPRSALLPGGEWKHDEGRILPTQPARWPILGVSGEDAFAYARWRTEKSEAAGEPWEYDLPSEEEWEKAARGVDGRKFPWGDHFDWTFCMSAWSPPESRRPDVVGLHLRGASPWGVLDLAGGAREPCRGWWEEGVTRPRRGGSWGDTAEHAFRAAFRSKASASGVTPYGGIRLVARRRAKPEGGG